jgi:hypothetical protein
MFARWIALVLVVSVTTVSIGQTVSPRTRQAAAAVADLKPVTVAVVDSGPR